MSQEEELLDLLWCEATQPSRNAATLTHNIGVAFRYFETVWEEKAKRIIGALVTLNAGPMHTTMWAALFQQMRTTDKPAIKVYILKQFANVCWTLPTSHAETAFRAFVVEVRPLLADVQAIVNPTFQKSFATTVRCFSSFAEKNLSDELFDVLYGHLKEGKRTDSLRAAAAVITAMANDNPKSPSPEQILRRAKYDLECLSFAILLDTLVSAEAIPGRILKPQRIDSFCDHLEETMRHILAAPQASEKVIPPCISTYRRLKQLCSSWEPVTAAPFTLFVLDALAQPKVSKLLLCPFLQFLQVTSSSWVRNSDILWKLTGSTDPFVRADAYTALASTAHVLEPPDRRLALADLLERLRLSIDEGCSYTNVAILKFLKMLLLHGHFPASTEELYLSKLLYVCRRHGMGLHHDVPALLELLNVFHSARVAPDALVAFTLELFLVSPDRAVTKKAFCVLVHFSTKMFLDSGVQSSGHFTNDLDYLEGAIQMQQEAPFEDDLLSLFRLHRPRGLAECIYARLTTFAESEAKSHASFIIVCDAVKEMCTASITDLGGNDFFKHTMLCLLSQLLVSHNNLSSDAYVSLVQACVACLQGNELEIRQDLHLLSSLVQHSWSVMITCTTVMFSIFVPESVSPTCRFFCTDSLSSPCYHLILACRDIALSNEVSFYESVFHEILASNTNLLSSCALLLRDTPFFLAELLESVSSWLECCIALAPCSPKTVFQLLTVLLEVGSAALTTQHEGGGDKQCFLSSVARECNGLLKHAIEIDLLLCCQEICNFLLLFVLQDAEEGFFFFQELIANNWALIGDLFLFCERIVLRLQSDSDAEALAAILKVLLALCDSVYSQHMIRVIPRCSLKKMLQLLHEMPDFAQKRQCIHYVFYILAASDANKSVEEKMCNLFSASSCDGDFFERVERFAELWNASCALTQTHLKEILTSSLNVEQLVCAAAVDVQCIPKAVEAVLRIPVEREVLDVLLLIVTEAKQESLSPLLFDVRDAVMGENDDVLKAIIRAYSWGWYGGKQTKQMLLSGAWRSLDTPLSRYLKGIFRFCHGENIKQDVFRKKLVSSLDDYACSFSYQESFSEQESTEVFPPEVGGKFSSWCVEGVLHRWRVSPLHPLCLLCDKDTCTATVFGTRNIHLLATLFSSGVDCEMSSWDPSLLLQFLKLFVRAAADTPAESELREWLQLSSWLLFCQVRFLAASEALDLGNEEEPDRLSLSEEVTTVFVQLSNLFFCSTIKTPDDAAVCVVRYAVHNSGIFTTGGISERVFWLVVQHCICEVWDVITTEVVTSLQEPAIVAFLCRAHVKVGFPFFLQRELHAVFTPQLLSYGKTDSELDEDNLRFILWLVGTISCSGGDSFVNHGASFLLRAPKLTDAADTGAMPSDRWARKRMLGAESNFNRNDARSLSAAIRHVTTGLAQRVLSDTTGAMPSSVLDAVGVLGRLVHSGSVDADCRASLKSNAFSLDEVYRIAHDFAEMFPLLDANASLDPPAHCLQHMLGPLPNERRVQTISDALCLNSVVSLLSKLLQGWLQESPSGSQPPAQLSCTLALYIPYLLRCDLPSYICALQCLRHLSICGATPETEAVYNIALPRLVEDLVDAQWGAGIAGCWYEVLIDFLGRVPGVLQEGGGQLYWRIWEGLWRRASSMELNSSEHFTNRAQQSVQSLFKKLVLKSTQWELCRLVVLDSGLQQPQVALAPAAACEFFTDSNTRVFFWMARELQERTWRSQLLQTQSAFVHHSAADLDADSSRSLFFDFEQAGVPLLESPDKWDEFLAGENAAFVVSERVHKSLFHTTDAVLVFLNRFNFSSIIQRRSVLYELWNIMLRYSKACHEGEMATLPWTEVYFDALYERTSWYDEGLWVACVLAAVTVSKNQPWWSQRVLASLIPASSSAWKRELMLCIGRRAKIGGGQREARQFFADASGRLSALRNPPPPWKRELLTAVLLLFSS
ncbi:hypothetical protein JKF63_01917 [Porcisia hertigi]|uniref:Uncharacterized protein n=1 Tax=Porcisia hertigi TaxID=2761500 RepID=A0A836IGN0_9TRYP|nr:hypothetical protein JKF63_01917 [Porcisia hertigi]